MSRKEKTLTEEEFYTQRKVQMKEAESNGMNLYPHKFEATDAIAIVKKEAEFCESNSVGENIVKSAGRIVSIRGHGKLYFFGIESDMVEIQLIINSGDEEIYKIAQFVKRGDIVGFEGKPGRSKSGEPSVFLNKMVLLAPCMRVIPSSKNSLINSETIYRKRHIDLIVNKESRQRFLDRTRIVQHVRNYLIEHKFVEVETPMMSQIHGGAAAKPFKTFHNELKLDLFLRVAPELYLKKLVVGGISRVFEIGKQFRNEGIDLTHNPEFTSVEFYQAYADHKDMMNHVERLLNRIAKDIRGCEKFIYNPSKREGESIEVELDFSLPFKRIDILTDLSNELGVDLNPSNIESLETLDLLMSIADKRGYVIDEPKTFSRVLAKFMDEIIEPKCINPTFVTGFPIATSPLAKDDRERAGLTERFELFVNGKELCNAYTELNIPSVQRQRFLMQAADANAGDEEAMPVDEDFCQALEFGLPPTGGCGIGIDRLVMYMTNVSNIRDVLFFPAMRPENK